MLESSKRAQRVADLLQQILANSLKREVNDPRLANIVLTAVKMSADLKHADIYFTMMDNTALKEAQTALKKATAYLRRLVAQQAELRYVPQLHFIYDESVERGAKITELIDKALAKDKSMKKEDGEE